MRFPMLRNTAAVKPTGVLLVAVLVLAPAWAPAQVDDESGGEMTARVVLELQQMREELRELRGLVESQAQEIENLKRRQRDQYLDLDRRIGGLEGAAVASTPRSTPPASSPETSPADAVGIDADGPVIDPQAEATGLVPPPSDLPEVREPLDAEAEIATLAAPSRTDVRELQQPTEAETQAYDQAFLALRETRYADAAEGFDRFLQDHPQSSLAPNALYWLGEVYYVTRDFETALGQFNDLLERYPGSSKEPDALLKIGFSHYELEHWIEARAALQQVAEQFPGTNYSRLAENRLRTMRLEGRL
mgnify:CR=1 FL=1